MKIITLVENTTKDSKLKAKHGLSFYIETYNRKILFDIGSDDTYIRNAARLGIDLTDVCTVIISHGHIDHGGALHGFLKLNSKAKIYLHRQAFEPYYIKVLFMKKYVGLNRELTENDRLVFTDDTMLIGDDLLLFSDVKGQFDTKSNRALMKKSAKGFEKDDFIHEQNLIVKSEDKVVLFTGCSHRGIANILSAAYKYKPVIQAVFGGFHLFNPVTKSTEKADVVERLAKELSEFQTTFYTGHCTGKKTFAKIQKITGNTVQQLHTGLSVNL